MCEPDEWFSFFDKKQMVCEKALLVFPMVCSKWTQFPDLQFKIHQVQVQQMVNTHQNEGIFFNY